MQGILKNEKKLLGEMASNYTMKIGTGVYN
jgi:hypothetical protein